MIKPQIPNIPGVGVVSDTLDFVKNLWGSMSVPGMSMPGVAVPTLSVEELDKKIADLKAVESWLSLNMNMLRGTIQALEVQRGTIATLKSMSATLTAVVKQQPGGSEKSLLESIPYASAFLFPSGTPTESASSAASAASAQLAQAAQAAAQAAALVAANAAAQKKSETDEKRPDSDAPGELSDAASQLINPMAWWNVLQDQFKQAVSTAIASEGLAKIGAAGTAMATDAVVALGEAAVKTNLAMTEKAIHRPAQEVLKRAAEKTKAATATASATAKAKPAAAKPKTAAAATKKAAVKGKPAKG